MLNAFWQLTKPRISLLFALTGVTAFFLEGSLRGDPLRISLLTIAIFLVGGAANALNQFFERDIDAQMRRTASKRPLPMGQLSPASALVFSIVIGVLGIATLWLLGTWLAALMGLITIIYYSFYYTLWLKPRTPYNIVIGGAAGAAAPLIAWAAATGGLGFAAAPAWMLFALVFFWTPPHFWALALCCRDDYARVAMPMLPIVYGDEATRQQIWWYSLSMLPLSLALALVYPVGKMYLVSAALLGVVFIYFAHVVRTEKTDRACWRLFGYSIIYILLIFLLLIADVLV